MKPIDYLLICLVLCMLVRAASADDVRWLQPTVQETANLSADANTGLWGGAVTDPKDPWIQLGGLQMDANTARHLYVRLSVNGGRSMQLFYDVGQGIQEPHSVRVQRLKTNGKPQVYRLDTSDWPGWRGTVQGLRVDIDGAAAGTRVDLLGLGWSEQPVTEVDGQRVIPLSSRIADLQERMAAWQYTLVATDSVVPASWFGSYNMGRFDYMGVWQLAHLRPGVETPTSVEWVQDAHDVRTEDLPGAVRSRFILGNREVTTQLTPLMRRGAIEEPEGSAVYELGATGNGALRVELGDMRFLQSWERRGTLHRSSVRTEGMRAELLPDGTARLYTDRLPVRVGVLAESGTLRVISETDGQYLEYASSGASGRLRLAFASSEERLAALLALNPDEELKRVNAHYRALLSHRIRTPEPVLDEGFRTALITMEYNYLDPFGWNECIHHWMTLWHQQAVGAALWAGQEQRVRTVNRLLADNLLPSGHVPHFNPDNTRRRDFGGADQFFAWQLMQHWRFTADRQTAQAVLPALERVIEATFHENDPDGEGLLRWGQQIGNQEDYVSTPQNGTSPSVEGINMLRTAATLARALGRDDAAAAYEARAQAIARTLRRRLWQPDLGRYAFFEDAAGNGLLPDGQYHTLIYPVLYGLLDPWDSWSSMRHLTDRLMGVDGEVYLSNNFACHVVCTAGPQAGAAQQPWAAWGLAEVGRRNAVWQPLRAAARWAMNDDHRGAWPEISLESTPAYFSPPAALYVQAVVEALFGLRMDRPAQTLHVRPCFPDHWPQASIAVNGVQARYRRTGDVLRYVVQTTQPLRRQVRWSLPPAAVAMVTVNGRPAPYRVESGVGCLWLTLVTEPLRDSVFEVHLRPIPASVQGPNTVAEGESLTLSAKGARVLQVRDPMGLLEAPRVSGDALHAQVRTGRLGLAQRFGRLGQMNFARRTVYVLVEHAGVRWWAPHDLTLLPRLELAGQVRISESGDAELQVTLRNNTERPMGPHLSVSIRRIALSAACQVPARSERIVRLTLPPGRLHTLTSGDNDCVVQLGSEVASCRVDASPVFAQVEALQALAAHRMMPLTLPADRLRPDTDWRNWALFSGYGHPPWHSSRPPMEALSGRTTLSVPQIPGLMFTLAERQLLVVGALAGSRSVSLPVPNQPVRKFYLLVAPLLDNHDTFSDVARVEVRTASGAVYGQVLRVPGDLDWWNPQEIVGGFATYRGERATRHALNPMPDPVTGDWPDAKPELSGFPQPALWTDTVVVHTPASLFNVIEVPLAVPAEVTSLSVTALNGYAALGIVGVTAELTTGSEQLDGTRWEAEPGYRDPRVLFRLNTPEALDGWEREGDAFTVAPVPSLFAERTLNSLAARGESATGSITSPVFTLRPGETRLVLRMQGGISRASEGPGTLQVAILDAATGEVLRRLYATSSHLLRLEEIDVRGLAGRALRLRLEDRNTDPSYAWLGVAEVSAAD